ncbi:hybrid sensor histidine kinase/response regulator [Luteimonas aquatica]|uniref:hybrid sensor histidine kinase/response regulator n=1 Tax=Luteimonas aquatica TaxID=450364 RepID=UPI001F587014|nr:PAS-domain containing protein [Luteimonas aquatica]
MPAPPLPRRATLRKAIPIALLLLAMTATAALAAWFAWTRAAQRDGLRLASQLDLRAQALQGMIDRYRVLPTVLALDPQLRQALSQSPGRADAALDRTPLDQKLLNQKLERANGATRVSTLTLIDRRGIAIAANNWREASSNVGIDYRFRPYYQQAMRSGTGLFYGIGFTTGVPGYFIAEAVRDDQGRAIGVIVVKITFEAIEREWAKAPEWLMLSDAHGIVFLGNRDALRYRALHALAPAERDALAATRQYRAEQLRPARLRLLDRDDQGTERVRIDAPPMPGTWLMRTRALPEQAWTLHALQDTRGAALAARSAAVVTLLAWLPLLLLGLFLRQRVRLARLRQRSREELERMVAHHAQALRSAQDGVVLAAHRAAQGQNASLEHLPHGVSVVDAQLRVVAWNSRYQDIFRYPQELLEIGRPIEDMLRYNARRGWLGPGPADEAVRRRLGHLRNRQPYLHERELPDGMVLEIRGNPLPDGGFVTSYADITSYKATARELRTLADTLRRRVADSTRDLRHAKAEAEDANRYKGRFVAAAVHDLLQPLNAARMLLGALRERLQGEPLALAERIDQSLEAQDDLLASLLELSRLDTGALQPKIEPVPLSPLFSALAAQFSVIAQSRGLRLDWVDTRLTVRSDALLLRRALQNLLSNALQYTREGGVLLGCRRSGDRGEGMHVRIEVWDTGIGIAESKQAAIFEEFRRLDSGVDRDRRNAGLGLSIVERIARLLGHEVGLRSRPGRGSVFSLRLPLAEAAAAAIIAPVRQGAAAPFAGRTAWVIDDDRDGAGALRTLLEGWGCRVETAHDRDGAIALRDARPRPDLLLLDYQLGETLGTDLLPALAGAWASPPPTVVVSGAREAGLRERLLAEGLHFLPKPVAPAALRALLSQLLLAARGAGQSF